MNYCQIIRRNYKWVILFMIIVYFYLIFSLVNDQTDTSSFQKVTIKVIEKGLPPGKKLIQQKSVINTTLLATHKIIDRVSEVKKFFTYFDDKNDIVDSLREVLIGKNFSREINVWEIAEKWVTKLHIVPRNAPLLPGVLHFLKETPIIIADILPKGSQLKILFTLQGGQKALFKPKWYDVETVVKGTVYSGRDRHNGEVVAFHLSRLLGLNRVPIVTIRNVDLNKDVLPVATSALKSTFFVQGEATCFYGVCKYCNKENSICVRGGVLEGSITLWLPQEWSLRKARHPWQRTYTDKHSLWETHTEYCDEVKNSKIYQDENRLLDLIEISIFDFLIDNGDRHHYEFFDAPQSKVLLIDNAKSFGDPFIDHIDILAPLYQCCRIRRSFLSILIFFQRRTLSLWVKKLLQQVDLSFILHKHHFTAIDRRLNLALAAVMVCFEEHGGHNVLVNS